MKMIQSTGGMRTLAAVGACVAAAALIGCGGGSSNTSKLTGKVNYKGAPVTGGTIELTSSSGAPYSIYIHDDGTFAADDAPVGTMKVAIETDSVTGPVATPPQGGSGTPASAAGRKKVVIPAKDKNPETSGLTWNTKTEKTKNFDLTD